MTVDLPIGGRTDVCSLCGLAVVEEEIGMVGLNGIICRRCAENIVRYTPAVQFVLTQSHEALALYEYQGYPGTPLFKSTAGVVVLEQNGTPVTTADALNTTYDKLNHSAKRLICYIPAGDIPPDYEQAITLVAGTDSTEDNTPTLPRTAVFNYHATAKKDIDDTKAINRYEHLQSLLPRPFAVLPEGIVTPSVPADVRAAIDDTLTEIIHSDGGQQGSLTDIVEDAQ